MDDSKPAAVRNVTGGFVMRLHDRGYILRDPQVELTRGRLARLNDDLA